MSQRYKRPVNRVELTTTNTMTVFFLHIFAVFLKDKTVCLTTISFYGRQLAAFYLYSRWRPPPFWFLSECHIYFRSSTVRNMTYFAVETGENRSNGSNVT